MRQWISATSVKWALALIMFISIVVLFFISDWMGRIIYPIHYKEEIKLHAKYYNVDPFMIASIIRVESNYKPDIVSRKSAHGIMQIMPDTAQWLIESHNLENLTLQDLADAAVNIEIGTLYLSLLKKQFHSVLEQVEDERSRIAVIASAYNAGPGNTANWINQGTWNGSAKSISSIPFGETRHYITRVLYYYFKYQDYYDEEFV